MQELLTRFRWLAVLFVCSFPTLTVPAAADVAGPRPGPSVGLALGSGGAGGLAHIAMLQIFDELGIRPARISGTSIGAVIGGLYAAGLSADEIEAIFDDFAGSELDALTGIMRSDLDFSDLFRSGLGNGGILDSSGFLEFLATHVTARDFDDLSIPLTVVATDFWTGEPVVIEAGDLFTAIEASMAVPGLFQPVRQGDRLLVDGGASKPLPFDLMLGVYDRVVAVDVSGTRQRSEGEAELTDLLFKTFELMQQSIVREMRLRQEPDLYLKPNTSGIRLLHFNRIEEILAGARPEADRLRRRLREWTAAAERP